MYILNEKEYIGNILASKKKPDDLSMGYLITLIAKYCYSDRINADELSDMIKKKLSEFDLENYQEYQYHNKIIATCQEICTGSTEHTFREREFIPIYESELAFIDSLPNDRQKNLCLHYLQLPDIWIATAGSIKKRQKRFQKFSDFLTLRSHRIRETNCCMNYIAMAIFLLERKSII